LRQGIAQPTAFSELQKRRRACLMPIQESIKMLSEEIVVHRIEQIDQIMTILRELRVYEMEELDKIEAKEYSKIDMITPQVTEG
jgi:hypothetical protein